MCRVLLAVDDSPDTPGLQVPLRQESASGDPDLDTGVEAHQEIEWHALPGRHIHEGVAFGDPDARRNTENGLHRPDLGSRGHGTGRTGDQDQRQESETKAHGT